MLPLIRNETRKGWIKRLCMLISAYIFLLLLSYGFPVAGDDWFFTTRYQNEDFLTAIRRGIWAAEHHYHTTNGRYFGNALSACLGCSDLWREIVRCGIILGVIVLIAKLCKVKKPLGFLVVCTLVIALPVQIYAQTYAWAAGFF